MLNKNSYKICKKCKSKEIKKDWFMRWKQRYKCKVCGHVFQNKSRKKKVEITKLWNEYCFWKQNYEELDKKYWFVVKTIQKRLDEYEFIPPIIMPREIILLMDTCKV